LLTLVVCVDDIIKKIDVSIKDLKPDAGFREKLVARLVSGRPLDLTPALNGARRGHIECDVDVDSLAYWNDPQGQRDQQFHSPFAVKVSCYDVDMRNTTDFNRSYRSIVLPSQNDTKYITFAPDRGGWNNIRMCMEIIFVIAAATGRTLVLPPKAPLYLLNVSMRH
jgi:hypothetical protein